jgi:hypothetical protein
MSVFPDMDSHKKINRDQAISEAAALPAACLSSA